MATLLAECDRASIDFPARRAADGRDFGHRIFDGQTIERLTEQRVKIGCAHVILAIGGRHDDHQLTAWLGRVSSLVRERRETAAPDFFIKFRELSADPTLTRTPARAELPNRRRIPCPAPA